MQKSQIAAGLTSGLMGLFLAAAPAQAATWVDPAGDWVTGYAGPLNADLDVKSFSVDYDAGTQVFTLTSVMQGAINFSTVGVYVIGVNTGTGPSRPFAAIGNPNVIFNQAITIRKDGTGSIGATALDPATIVFLGDTITLKIALGLMPSTGFTPQQYGFNIWPRSATSGANVISDFGPDNANLTVTGLAPVPEPASWMLLLSGFGMLGATMRRSLRRTTIAFA